MDEGVGMLCVCVLRTYMVLYGGCGKQVEIGKMWCWYAYMWRIVGRLRSIA